MEKYTQAGRFLQISTPLEPDFFLLNALTATEGISQLYQIEAELLHEESAAWPKCDEFDPKKILGQKVAIEMNLPDHGRRFFNGIVSRISQGFRGRRTSQYSVTIVPEIWKFTQKKQSRIFQQKTVQGIIEIVLADLVNPLKFDLRSEYKARNYCVQYRESDFDFISRLMEEEGIYYFFRHTEEGSHEFIISDAPTFSNDCPEMFELNYYDSNTGDVFEAYISEWLTDYKIGPGQIAFRDHHIQQPGKKLEKTTPTKFIVSDNDKWEVYDYPGGYARKFDGISAQGTEQAGELNNIDPDGQQTSDIAMQVIDAQYMVGTGKSDCCSFTSGHRMKMNNYPHGNVNGQYVLTSVSHRAIQAPSYQADESLSNEETPYENRFTALSHGRPEAVPFRPIRKTPKPIVHGAQTAVVVGAGTEEIYTDKYGRVKVQFFWDREGETDGLDSCWLPVAQAWSGKGWGSMFIPRVGMEVIVHFLEGDPDRPIVDGCVYHPTNMPPYAQPEHKTRSGIKTDSSKGGNGYNELRFEDLAGSEQIFIHGEKDLDVRIKNDRREWIGKDRHLIVKEDFLEKIGDSRGSHHLTIMDDQRIKIGADRHVKVGSNEAIEIGANQTIKVTGNQGIKVTGNHSTEATGTMYLKGMSVVVEGMTQLTLKVGGNFVDINSGGVFIQGTMVMINSGGGAGSGTAVGGCSPTAPEEPAVADDDKPGSKMKLEKQSYERKRKKSSPADPTKKSWIKLKMVDEEGKPVSGQAYEVRTPGGNTRSGSLDSKGEAHIAGIDPGNCDVTFPNLDKDAWEDA